MSADRGRFALAVYELGAGNYGAALDAAADVAAGPLSWRSHALPIVIEAASRLGERSRAESALAELRRRATASGTAWARAASLRSEALLAGGEAPEGLYREALDLLHGPEVRLERARTHLLYGEWLRRAKRRLDARAQLTDAHEMFRAFGAIGFAERAHRELRATGGRARARTVDNGTTLTPQERVVAQLAASGATNQEIATQLFLSASTVDYHLGKVYRKLGLRSRRELRGVFRD